MTAGDIYTVAGNGRSFSGDGGLALRAGLDGPAGVSVDGAGDIAFTAVGGGTGNTTVDLIAARSGTFFGRRLTAGRVYVLGGNGIAGWRGENGPARDAEFCIWNVAAIVFDGSGNLVMANTCSNQVELIAVRSGRFFGRAMTAGDVYAIAGTGGQGFFGDGGPAAKARLRSPTAVAVDHHGNVLIADGWLRVRVIAAATGTFYNRKMTAGYIYTIAGDGKSSITFYGQAMTVGHIYIVAGRGATLGDGGPAARALLSSPFAVTVSRTGSLLVSDGGDNRLRAISP
jgi:hypothetical protein